MTEATKTCTVGPSAVTGKRCGKPAIYVEGEFAECVDHAHDAGSLYLTRVKTHGHGPAVGDKVDVHRHGKVYTGTVVHVTRTGKVDAKVTYDNGATRVVRVCGDKINGVRYWRGTYGDRYETRVDYDALAARVERALPGWRETYERVDGPVEVRA